MQSLKSTLIGIDSNNIDRNSIDHQMRNSIESSASPPNRKTQVVIVGAGLAGLATAQRLCQSGFKDVIVLEAQDRVGGRVHTVSHSEYLLELGAQWLHGAEDNPLHSWLTAMNMLDDFEDATAAFDGVFCTDSNEEVDQKLVQRVLHVLFESKLSIFKNERANLIEADGIKNAAAVLEHLLGEAIKSDPMLKANKSLVNAMFSWFLRFENIENGCDSMGQVSLASYTDYNDVGDGTLLNFKHGYRSLLQWFVGAIPAKWFHLNHQVLNVEMFRKQSGSTGYIDSEGNPFSSPMLVRCINLEDQSIAKLKLEHKTSNVLSIECDHVVVTASLGFLKKNHETFFTPKLPSIKRDLVNSVGFGTVNKIVLQFEAPFWRDGIKMIWTERDDKVIDGFPPWARDIISFDVVRRQPNLLIGWIGGRGAKMMELESDEQISKVCLDILDKFLPSSHAKPSKLVACFCSRWNSNPFTCGSYSFQSMESLDMKVEKLHEPIYNLPPLPNGKLIAHSTSNSRLPRILFAGEATAGPLYSTTHGAIISGWREADRLTDCLSEGNKSNIQQAVNPCNLIGLEAGQQRRHHPSK